MLRNVVPCLAAAALLAQNPGPLGGKPGAPRPWRQPLIAPLTLPLTGPEALEASACLRKALPTWALGPATFAGRREIPRTGITLRCRVDTEDGPEPWEFLLERNHAGQFRLRVARRLD